MSDVSIQRHSDTYPYISPKRFARSLQGQVALVTGASRGIGRSSAMAFARAGAAVACLSRTLDGVERVAEELTRLFGISAIAIAADVSDPAAPAKVLSEIERRLGPVDILLNNAAVSKINTLEHEADFASWWHVMEVNVRGPAALSHAVVPGMLIRGRGCIINVVSRCGSSNVPYTTAYSASKAALIRLTHSLDLEVRSRGVYTYAVQPGYVPTDLSRRPGVIDLETVSKVRPLQQMLEGTIGTFTESPELAANTFVFLAADEEARYLSGKYINAQQDLEKVIKDVRLGADGRTEAEGLYVLKVDEL